MLMAGRLAVALALASIVAGAGTARAFTMGETMAATGVQSTLASGGAQGAAGTINSVKSALGKVTTEQQAKLDAVARPWSTGRGGSGWALAGGKGWAGGGGKGWAVATNSGWGAAGKGAWASGGWSTN
jgi:hypothetical protein